MAGGLLLLTYAGIPWCQDDVLCGHPKALGSRLIIVSNAVHHRRALWQTTVLAQPDPASWGDRGHPAGDGFKSAASSSCATTLHVWLRVRSGNAAYAGEERSSAILASKVTPVLVAVALEESRTRAGPHPSGVPQRPLQTYSSAYDTRMTPSCGEYPARSSLHGHQWLHSVA